jgi:polysaccharide pyruvyl transferase WcaK-like protein
VISKELTLLKSRSKESFYQRKFITWKNNKERWSVINDLLDNTRGQKKIVSKLALNGSEVTDTFEIAQSINEYLTRIGSVISDQFEDSTDFNLFDTVKRCNITCFLNPRDSMEICCIIKSPKFNITNNGFNIL